MTRSCTLSILLLLFSIELRAQNHLYTTEQYGIDGAMLGGAVTAGADDVSMTFYNPASIHKVSAQFNVSLIQPTLRTFGFREFWRDNENSRLNTDFSLKPIVLYFKVSLKKLDLAFLKITKSELSDAFSTRQEILNNELLTTRFFDYEYSGEDDWYGLGSNLKLGPNLYVGLSQFLSSSRFNYRNSTLLQELDRSQNDQLNRFFDSKFDGAYSNIGFITRLGLLFDTDKHDLGFTLTTPTYLRLNKGGDLFNTNLSTVNGETIVDQVIDTDISPVIKTPWEFNLGYSLELNPKQKIWLNASYHTGIAEYNMSTSTTAGERISWQNGSKSVFNYSLGFSNIINPKLQLSGGIRSNNFAYENKAVSSGNLRNTILDGNHMHFVIGSKLQIRRSTILLGVDYGRITNTPNESDFQRIPNIDTINPNLNELKKSTISILLTYGFILDEIKKLRGK